MHLLADARPRLLCGKASRLPSQQWWSLCAAVCLRMSCDMPPVHYTQCTTREVLTVNWSGNASAWVLVGLFPPSTFHNTVQALGFYHPGSERLQQPSALPHFSAIATRAVQQNSFQVLAQSTLCHSNHGLFSARPLGRRCHRRRKGRALRNQESRTHDFCNDASRSPRKSCWRQRFRRDLAEVASARGRLHSASCDRNSTTYCRPVPCCDNFHVYSYTHQVQGSKRP